MATPTIPNGEEYFFPIIYEGNGAGQRVGKFVPFTDNGTIDNSVIFNGPDTAQLTRTPSSGGNQDTFTFSCWAKRSRLGQSGGGGSHQLLLSAGNDVNNFTFFGFRDSGSLPSGGVAESLNFVASAGGSTIFELSTSRTFEDTSSYNHYMVVYDSGNSTSGDRIKLYVNGERVTAFNVETYPSQNQDSDVNENGVVHRVGAFNLGTNKGHFDGYLAEVNLIDGTALTPDTFGVTDTSTGRWIPKTLSGITYGTNGFRLEFGDSSALGDDTSGNTNDFTATNLASTDQTTDSPTQNHATLQGTGGTLSEGNLKLVTGNSDFSHHNATLKPRSGKYYAEFTCDSMGRSEVGVVSTLNVPYSSNTTRLPATSDGSVAGYMYYGFNGSVYYTSANASAATYATYTSTDIIGIALDLDNHTVQFFKNNSSQGTISLPNGNYTFAMGDGATGYSGGWTANFGQKSFTYTPPTGFLALQQDNLPETAKGISGLVWTKNRDATDNHQLYDSSRGKQLVFASNTTAASTTVADGLQKFLAGGQQIEDSDAINTSGESYVSWNWVANGSTTASNTDGSITSTVQANTTAGFSIVEYTGNGGNAAATIGHGLSSAPEWMMVKFKDSVAAWSVYHKSVGATKRLQLNSTTTPLTDANIFNNTEPTSTVFSVGSSLNQTTVYNFIVYCWHGVDGFSKFGKYTGNGVADGPFIYTGFRPAWILFKANNTASWYITDNKMFPFNPNGAEFHPNTTAVQTTLSGGRGVDYLSNGFKIRQESGYGYNYSGVDVFYMAFAEHPFVGDGTSPVTAR